MYVTPGTHSTPANGAAKPPADPAGLAAQIGAALGQPAEDATSGIAEDGIKLGAKIKAALDDMLDAAPDLDTMAVPDLPNMSAMTNTKSSQQSSASGRTRGG